ncbi:MAG: hypothetical protein FK730_07495 [Asgard group archaeon]|nr:hypothetical protein [Asgard group archaeon]
MEKKTNVTFTIIVLVIVLISVIAISILQPWNDQQNDDDIITFTPTEMLSHPGHTAWLLAEVDMPNVDSNLQIEIETNSSIEYEIKYWGKLFDSNLIEIFLYPNQSHLDYTIEVSVTVSGSEIGITRNSAYIKVVDWTSTVTAEIIEMQERFIEYLEENCSSFQINESTNWEAFGNAPMILIVEHYLFKSEYWEMELSRHVMIQPHDWVKIYLRPRRSSLPCWSGIINSWGSGNHTIEEIEPPEEIYR